jgi:hypothetical protein
VRGLYRSGQKALCDRVVCSLTLYIFPCHAERLIRSTETFHRAIATTVNAEPQSTQNLILGFSLRDLSGSALIVVLCFY